MHAVHGKRHFCFVKADAVKEITVSENTSVSSLAKELDDQGVINYHSVFKLYLTLKHQTDTSVLAGAYQLNPSMDYGQIVDALANTASTETVQITIPEVIPSRRSVRCCWTTISAPRMRWMRC